MRTATGTAVTDYVGGMVYERNRLQFVPTAEGRWLPTELAGGGGNYEYSYKDHLGNLRLSFRKAPAVAPFTATLETEAAATEEAAFERMSQSRNGQQSRTGSRSGRTTVAWGRGRPLRSKKATGWMPKRMPIMNWLAQTAPDAV